MADYSERMPTTDAVRSHARELVEQLQSDRRDLEADVARIEKSEREHLAFAEAGSPEYLRKTLSGQQARLTASSLFVAAIGLSVGSVALLGEDRNTLSVVVALGALASVVATLYATSRAWAEVRFGTHWAALAAARPMEHAEGLSRSTAYRLLKRARAEEEGGRPNEAFTLYNEVASYFADDPDAAFSRDVVASALVGKGRVLERLGHHEDAAAAFDEVLRLFGPTSELMAHTARKVVEEYRQERSAGAERATPSARRSTGFWDKLLGHGKSAGRRVDVSVYRERTQQETEESPEERVEATEESSERKES